MSISPAKPHVTSAVRNRDSGRCLDARNGSSNPPGQQAVLQVWDCITSPGEWNAHNQMWVDELATSVPEPPIH
ncbi:MAG: hypothetical protein QOE03_3457 [Micromonosporaceae bacterium]|nr:hypothetical protein [Micromonosporaceae bacterium]